MSRVSALPLAALLLAAVVHRAVRPSMEPPARPVAAAAELPAPPPEPAPAPPLEAPAPPPTPPPAPPPAAEPVLGAGELLQLVEARFPDETILAYARVSGRAFRPSPDELVALRKGGMSDSLLGRLLGVPEAPPANSQAVSPIPASAPPVTVFVPVNVTVVEAPPPPPAPEPFVSTVVVVCAAHGRPGCCLPPALERPALYQPPPFFKTRAFMPTKRLPSAEDVARRR